MSSQNIPLFKAMSAKMDYLDQRQKILAHNVANADTPGYRPRDLVDVDFGQTLTHILQNKSKSGVSPNIRLQATHEGHMPQPGATEKAEGRKQKKTYEVAPAGNAVIIEEQMVKAGRTTMDYTMMSNLYRKQVGMIRLALGRQS